MARILYGKPVADKIYEKIKMKDEAITLAILKFSNNTGTVSYANSIVKKCNELEIDTVIYDINEKTNTNDILNLIQSLNSDNNIKGIMPLQPIPIQFIDIIKENINPKKDIDCVGESNIVNYVVGNNQIKPCTAVAVIELLKYYDIDVEGKNIVVVGRSLTVGKPVALLMSNANATVSLCHSKTIDLKSYTSRADILITAIGKSKFFTADMIKEKAIVIDIGINKDEEGNICGDVDFDNVVNKVAAITPVPNGVGSITTSVLLKNLTNTI